VVVQPRGGGTAKGTVRFRAKKKKKKPGEKEPHGGAARDKIRTAEQSNKRVLVWGGSGWGWTKLGQKLKGEKNIQTGKPGGGAITDQSQ